MAAGAVAAPPLFPFVFVGCWNQPGVTGREEDLPRDKVAEAVSGMREYIQYIILGGDNVYPRPLASGEKNKFHDPTVFDEGIKLYAASGKQILGSFGNHNVDTLGHQMETFGLSKTYYHREFADRIHLLVLDTNIILNKHTPGAAEEQYDKMRTWFGGEVASLPAGHRYFVVQHEPYFTAREKKGFGELPNADPFLEIMFARLPIAVLCADTHHYQHATIGKVGADPRQVIHQFIVGTGGASPDSHKPDFSSSATMRERYIYTKVQEIPGYGFLIIPDPEPSHFVFKRVLSWPPSVKGGYRRTYKRRKAARKSQKQKLHRKRR
jgi:hypothetical protein